MVGAVIAIWLMIGLVGWATLVAYRLATDHEYNDVPLAGWALGFVACLLLGPCNFAYFFYLLIGRYCGKATDKRD